MTSLAVFASSRESNSRAGEGVWPSDRFQGACRAACAQSGLWGLGSRPRPASSAAHMEPEDRVESCGAFLAVEMGAPRLRRPWRVLPRVESRRADNFFWCCTADLGGDRRGDPSVINRKGFYHGGTWYNVLCDCVVNTSEAALSLVDAIDKYVEGSVPPW